MRKIIKKLSFCALLFMLLHIPLGIAMQDREVITIESGETKLDIEQFMTVYQQNAGRMPIEVFRSNLSYLPNQRLQNAHLGFAENGLWLTAKLRNNSAELNWFIAINFSQLATADLYLYDGNTQLISISDGNLNKRSAYNYPTFNVDLAPDKTLDLYIYVASSTFSTITPITLSTTQIHNRDNQFQTLVWGLYYGAMLIFLIYAVFFMFQNQSVNIFVYLVHLYFIFCGLLVHSGHINFLSEYEPLFGSFMRSDILSLAIYMTSAFMTAHIIPIEKTQKQLLLLTYSIVPMSAISILAFLLFDIESITRFIISAGAGILCIVFCLSLSTIALKKGFLANKAIAASWAISAGITVLSILFALHLIPSSGLNGQLYSFCLVLQTGTFMYAMVSKNQRELEEEVILARTDAENNYLVIEEQNVHLNIARRDAENASDVKSQFLANMSHEIRTPLNAIMGFSKELELHKNSSEREEHVKIINSAASDLLELVNDILDFSKMEAGLLTLNESAFSPRELFEDVAATMSKTAHNKQLEFLYDVQKIPDSIIGDRIKVKQLLINLLSNALKFTNYGYVGLQVTVPSWTPNNVVLEIEVIDSGIGISEEGIKSIFKAFHQLDDDLSRAFEGSGLGLVICQELVYMMKGKLEVTSQPSVGSTFKVTLPFKLNTVKPKSQTISVDSHRQPAIVFDPWFRSRRYLAKQLNYANYNVSTYETLSLALENVSEEAIVFITLPFKQLVKRNEIISRIHNIKAKNLVLLYSGPTPSVHNFPFVANSPYIIRLPLTERKVEQLHKPQEAKKEEPGSLALTNIPSIKILAVDDMELNLRLMEAWFKHSPATLDLAYDAQTAISKCNQFEYDLILMDVQMPNMDGMTAAKEIRKTEKNLGTPIIAVTAYAMADEKEQFLKNGMDDFLSKPIKQQELINIIQLWCENNETTDEDLRSINDELHSSKMPLSENSNESIDWSLSLERANNNTQNALGFMEDFVAYLQVHLEDIEKLKTPDNNQDLLTLVHKMHGACCYTGVPKLQDLCAYFQEQVKYSPKIDAGSMILKITLEMRHIIEDWQKRRSRLQ